MLLFLYHSDSQSERPEGQMGILMENMVLFSSTVLQKLYCGRFLGDAESLLHFFADQIVVVRRLHRKRHKHDTDTRLMRTLDPESETGNEKPAESEITSSNL